VRLRVVCRIPAKPELSFMGFAVALWLVQRRRHVVYRFLRVARIAN
jgi:hypothetical protein